MTNLFNRFIKDESGATAIEYGLIAAIVAVGLIAVLNFLGDELGGTFNDVAAELQESRGNTNRGMTGN